MPLHNHHLTSLRPLHISHFGASVLAQIPLVQKSKASENLSAVAHPEDAKRLQSRSNAAIQLVSVSNRSDVPSGNGTGSLVGTI